MFVRGTDQSPAAMQTGQGVGRDWLARQVAGQGAEVVWAVAYRRACPEWNSGLRVQARQAASDGSVWVFSSTQALAHLRELLPGQDWTRASAIATHPRIAEQAQALGFASVRTCPPSPEGVLALLKSDL
jgi:uroporphyrinogen-III synthase